MSLQREGLKTGIRDILVLSGCHHQAHQHEGTTQPVHHIIPSTSQLVRDATWRLLHCGHHKQLKDQRNA